jgi:hypothetical protein
MSAHGALVTNCKNNRAALRLTVVYEHPERQHESCAMRLFWTTLALICALLPTGCATEHLGTAAPEGINLTGEWNLDPNLSDDPNNPGAPDKAAPQGTPRNHRGRGGRGSGGGAGGMPPMGSPGGGGGYNFLPIAQISRGAPHLSITQKGANLVVKTQMQDGTQKTDEYVAGTSTTIPDGDDTTAKRTVGWRGAVFVVTTDVKKGGTREDDFALDDSGHLIVTTQTKGSRGRDGEIKRVYDRVRGADSIT